MKCFSGRIGGSKVSSVYQRIFVYDVCAGTSYNGRRGQPGAAMAILAYDSKYPLLPPSRLLLFPIGECALATLETEICRSADSARESSESQ